MKIVAYEYFIRGTTSPQFLYVDADYDMAKLPEAVRQIIAQSKVRNAVDESVVQNSAKDGVCLNGSIISTRYS